MANTYSTTLVSASSQAWQANSSSSLNNYTSYATWEFWIKPTSAIGSGSLWGLLTKDDVASNRTFAVDYYNNGSTKYIRTNIGTSPWQENSIAQTLTVSSWTHVAVVFDGTISTAGDRYSFYINGSYIGHGTTAGTPGGVTSVPSSGSAKLGIGCYTTATPALFANAQFDEVRVWNVARTASEIAANYQTELTGTESGLLAYYKLENNGNDSTSNANTLTAYGSPTFTTDVPFSGGGGGGQNSNLLMYQ